MQAIENIVEVPATQVPVRELDLLLIYPGAVEGGVDQIIIDLVPEVVKRPEVRAWAFERGVDPVPAVALVLDVEAGALPDIVDVCEDTLSSRLRDEPALVMQSLVDMPARAKGGGLPWGVRHSRIDAAAGAGKLRQNIAQEQAIGEVVLAVVSNVRTKQWDRKTIAPTLLSELLERVTGGAQVATGAYQVMQRLLAEHPASETLTRQFRMHGHKLVKANLPILLQEAALDELRADLRTTLDGLAGTLGAQADIAAVAGVWRRLAGGIGFSTVEAAYIASLLASNGRVEQ